MQDVWQVGTVAPDVVLHGDQGRVLTVSPAHRPRVLAFVRGWAIPHGREAELRVIRAELRGLGAGLTILSGDAVWSFRPDDDVELCAGAGEHLEGELHGAAARFGLDGDHDGVFVIDERDVIRFAHSTPEPIGDGLADALATAGAAIRNKPRPTAFTRREWTLTCLIAGFTIAVLSGTPPAYACATGRSRPTR